jgi:hypothetical protein
MYEFLDFFLLFLMFECRKNIIEVVPHKKYVHAVREYRMCTTAETVYFQQLFTCT